MQKYRIFFINLAISFLITSFLILMSDDTIKYNYKDVILFAFAYSLVLSFQLVVNLCIAIYFFIKKDNAKAKKFLLSMAILIVLALIPAYLIGFGD